MENIITEQVPCGTCITTQTLNEQGEITSQDIEIVVDPEIFKMMSKNTPEI